MLLTLTCHPATPCDAVRDLVADVERKTDVLRVTFRLTGQLDRLRIPQPDVPRVGTRLWEHTCFEAFLGIGDTEAYHEFNVAPSCAWTVYPFARYREGGPLADLALAPDITVQRTGKQLELAAGLCLTRLSAQHRGRPLRLGLSAVVEALDGTLSYWALRHPPGRPDFHHPDAFAVLLAPLAPS